MCHDAQMGTPRFALCLPRHSPQECFEHHARGERPLDQRVEGDAQKDHAFRPRTLGEGDGHREPTTADLR